MTVITPPPSDALQNLLGRHWHHLPATEVGQLLETNLETGLDLFEVKHRRERFGPNQLTPKQGRSLWMRFLLQFTMDDERLKNPPGKGQVDYFDELLERIRDIRASERRVYLRVREILALAADYEPTEPETQVFFQTIQNKLHFAATGKTAAELIAERADSAQPNMGLTAWHGGVVRKGDVTVAKNYLREDEIEELNRLVVMFLDFAEDQARRRKQIFLQNWLTRLHDFLNLNERAILPDAGCCSTIRSSTSCWRRAG